MDYFSRLREKASPSPSYREIGTSLGLNFARIGDLLNNKNGTPTLEEFLALCDYFGVDAPDTLRKTIETVKGREKDKAKSLDSRDAASDMSVPDDTQRIADELVRGLGEGDRNEYGLAADIEEDKWLEAEGGDGR